MCKTHGLILNDSSKVAGHFKVMKFAIVSNVRLIVNSAEP